MSNFFSSPSLLIYDLPVSSLSSRKQFWSSRWHGKLEMDALPRGSSAPEFAFFFLFYSWTVITISNSDTANKGKFPHIWWLFCWLRGFFFFFRVQQVKYIRLLQRSAYLCCSPVREQMKIYILETASFVCAAVSHGQANPHVTLRWSGQWPPLARPQKVPVTARDLCLSSAWEYREERKPAIWNLEYERKNNEFALRSRLFFKLYCRSLKKKKKDITQLLFHIIKNKSISGYQISFSAPFLPPDKHAVLKKTPPPR